MTSQHLLLELLHIIIPQLGSLTIERTRATHELAHHIHTGPYTRNNYSLIRLPKQTLQTQQHTLHIVNSTPLILQNIQANPAAEVDIRVVDWSLE